MKNIMRFSRFTAVVICLSSCMVSLHAWGQDDSFISYSSKLEQDIEQLLELIGIREQVEAGVEQVLMINRVEFDQQRATPQVEKLVSAYNSDLERIVRGVIGWDNLKATYIFYYAKEFSQKEVDDILTFFRSKTGEKLIAGQSDAALQASKLTKHLIEADMAPAVQSLRSLLSDGVKKISKATINEGE